MNPAANAFWVALIKPFLAVAFFAVAFVIAGLIVRHIPEGRIKRLLTRPLVKGIGPRRYRWWDRR